MIVQIILVELGSKCVVCSDSPCFNEQVRADCNNRNTAEGCNIKEEQLTTC